MLFTYAPGKNYFLEAAPCIQLVSFLSYILWLKTALCETICRDNEFVWARAYCSTTWGTWWVSCVSFWDRALLTLLPSLRGLDFFWQFSGFPVCNGTQGTIILEDDYGFAMDTASPLSAWLISIYVPFLSVFLLLPTRSRATFGLLDKVKNVCSTAVSWGELRSQAHVLCLT